MDPHESAPQWIGQASPIRVLSLIVNMGFSSSSLLAVRWFASPLLATLDLYAFIDALGRSGASGCTTTSTLETRRHGLPLVSGVSPSSWTGLPTTKGRSSKCHVRAMSSVCQSGLHRDCLPVRPFKRPPKEETISLTKPVISDGLSCEDSEPSSTPALDRR